MNGVARAVRTRAVCVRVRSRRAACYGRCLSPPTPVRCTTGRGGDQLFADRIARWLQYALTGRMNYTAISWPWRSPSFAAYRPLALIRRPSRRAPRDVSVTSACHAQCAARADDHMCESDPWRDERLAALSTINLTYNRILWRGRNVPCARASTSIYGKKSWIFCFFCFNDALQYDGSRQFTPCGFTARPDSQVLAAILAAASQFQFHQCITK